MPKHLPKGFAAIVLLTMSGPALAGELAVQDGWFRALPAGLPSGGYFTLHNGTAKPVALIGAASSACGTIMLHQSSHEGGMSAMHAVKSVEVPAGGAVAFAPGSYHLMCMHPTAEMKPGATVPVTLEFEGGLTLKADFAVKNAKGQ